MYITVNFYFIHYFHFHFYHVAMSTIVTLLPVKPLPVYMQPQNQYFSEVYIVYICPDDATPVAKLVDVLKIPQLEMASVLLSLYF